MKENIKIALLALLSFTAAGVLGVVLVAIKVWFGIQ